jgi:transposase
MIDAVAQSLADVTISHFTSQLSAVDEAITQTIDNDPVLRRKRYLLLSISGVGKTLAGVVLAELPGPDVLHSGAEVVAYAGLNPSGDTHLQDWQPCSSRSALHTGHVGHAI